MEDMGSRRPLKVRNAIFSQNTARWLSHKNVTPNQISIASIGFAALAAFFLVMLPAASGAGKWMLPILAAAAIQCRLLCNLFDGMVAVEGGKATPSGELFNDLPDRFADPIILIAAGYSSTAVAWSGTLGWLAGLLAVMTAYVRILAKTIGAPTDFQGPMAKQQRMALLTGACLLTPLEGLVVQQGYLLPASLMVIAAGCLVTIYRRVKTAYLFLEKRNHV
ncbi:MAG: CDP-alcohol phosphatidyltransferase family protein [Syntrophobacteraceae bacterium]